MYRFVIPLLLLLCIGFWASDVDWLAYAQKYFAMAEDYYQQQPILFISVFFIAFTLLVSLLLPGSLFLMLLAGALFGTVEGSIICILAGTLGATNLLLLTRYFLEDKVRARYGHRMKKLDAQMQENGILYLLIMRLTPGIPTNVIALMMGLTTIPLVPFILVTMVGIAPWYVIYVSAGETLMKLDSLSDIVSSEMLMVMGGICILLVISVLLKNRFLSGEAQAAIK